MTLWARLTWQAAGPDRLAVDLAARLGLDARPGVVAPGTWLFDLGAATLEVRPWVREGPGDNPRSSGRLVLEPVPGGDASSDAPAGGPAGTMSRVAGRLRLAAIGWATVDTDRAEDDLDMWLGPPPASGADAPPDPHLGAFVRVREAGSLPGDWLAFVEPSTEGRAAASLARDGEGPCALYLWAVDGLDAWCAWAAGAGVALRGGVPDPGPFGRQVALAGSPPAGPHVLVVERSAPASSDARTGTIRS